MSGFRDFYMQKAAYVQSLANIAIIMHTVHETFDKDDFTVWMTI